ncbi:MAG TPA: hypothetical protein VGN60_07660 [Devosia sp.]|jgi:hypothetical protein|nr:hypothetical protein [Devosia sp.]
MTIGTFSQSGQCQDKKPFATWAIARGANPRHLDIYRCPHCGQFHIGHKPKGMGRPKPPPPAIELEF